MVFRKTQLRFIFRQTKMAKQLYIKKISKKGRGVYSKSFIQKDEIIEVCPLLVLPESDYDVLIESHLADYFFTFNREEKTLAIALGFGSLYNHTKYSNAAYLLDTKKKRMTYYALSEIPAGTEICINYAGEHGLDFSEWFKARQIDYKSD